MRTRRIVHYYARYLAHPSGVTDSIDHWAEATATAGTDTVIMAAKPRGGRGNEFARAALVRTTAHWGRGRSTWVPIGLVGSLRRGDLLVLHEGWVVGNAVAAAVARLRGIPYVVVPHGVYESGIVDATRDPGGIRRAIERRVLRSASAVHVFYEGERDVVRAFEPRVRRFLVVPNGAPAATARWDGGGDYFLWIGRFDPHHKGLDNLVRAWSNLASPRPRLVLAGPDFLGGRERIRALTEECGVSDVVEIRNRVTGEEKVEVMRHARAYIHPSRWESCSIMLLEALAVGMPSLISASIHAAHELEPIGVLRSTAFDGSSSIASALSSIDRDHDVADRAYHWAAGAGGWDHVGREYITQLSEVVGGAHT
jgi:glycosyltransferase involved in cell wall biosynthesis